MRINPVRFSTGCSMELVTRQKHHIPPVRLGRQETSPPATGSISGADEETESRHLLHRLQGDDQLCPHREIIGIDIRVGDSQRLQADAVIAGDPDHCLAFSHGMNKGVGVGRGAVSGLAYGVKVGAWVITGVAV